MFKKILTILIFTSLTLSAIVFPSVVNAGVIKTLDFTPQITIPGSEFQDGIKVPSGTAETGLVDTVTEREVTIVRSTLIGRYIKAIYNYAIGITGILAVIMISFGGMLWLTSGGSPEKINQAKTFIVGALIGLALVLFSYTLLKTINTKLVEMPSIDTIILQEKQYGCCSYVDPNSTASPPPDIAEDITNVDCTQKGGKFSKNASANKTGTVCLQNGCCTAIETKVIAMGEAGAYYYDVNYCYEVNESICNVMAQEDPLRKYKQLPNLCSEYSECKDNEASCFDVSDGKECDNAERVCYCYAEKPYFGEGMAQEPCGNDNSRCYEKNDGEHTTATGCNHANNWYQDDYGGRKCLDSYICCYLSS